MELVNPTDDQLREAFAVNIAGWLEPGAWKHGKWLESADAVLPWLEEYSWRTNVSDNGVVILLDIWSSVVVGSGDTFTRAAVIALLRAHGHEITLTPTP